MQKCAKDAACVGYYATNWVLLVPTTLILNLWHHQYCSESFESLNGLFSPLIVHGGIARQCSARYESDSNHTGADIRSGSPAGATGADPGSWPWFD